MVIGHAITRLNQSIDASRFALTSYLAINFAYAANSSILL